MNILNRWIAQTLIGSLILAGAPLVYAAPPPSLEGYSPVAYFTEGKPTKGRPEFRGTHNGDTYFFQSAEELSVFSANPEKYLPRYKQCPYSLSLGKKLPIDPTNFSIIGGHLLLFHQSEQGDGLAQFRSSGLSDEALIERADKQYVLLRF